MAAQLIERSVEACVAPTRGSDHGWDEKLSTL